VRSLSQKKPTTKIGLVEWLKVKALSSNSSITKKKREREMLRRWYDEME
jgi:hypothetical protein